MNGSDLNVAALLQWIFNQPHTLFPFWEYFTVFHPYSLSTCSLWKLFDVYSGWKVQTRVRIFRGCTIHIFSANLTADTCVHLVATANNVTDKSSWEELQCTIVFFPLWEQLLLWLSFVPYSLNVKPVISKNPSAQCSLLCRVPLPKRAFAEHCHRVWTRGPLCMQYCLFMLKSSSSH